MPVVQLADHRARLEVERSEQVGGAVAQIIGGVALGLAGTHRQHGLAAVQRLDLALLVHAQDQRAVGWIEIQPDDVAHLVDEQRVFGEPEAFDPVGLQRKGPPDAADHALAQSAAFGHRAAAPVSRIWRRAL